MNRLRRLAWIACALCLVLLGAVRPACAADAKQVNFGRTDNVPRVGIPGDQRVPSPAQDAAQPGHGALISGLRVVVPPFHLCTDNAAMIAAAGWQRLRVHGPDAPGFDVDPSLAECA